MKTLSCSCVRDVTSFHYKGRGLLRFPGESSGGALGAVFPVLIAPSPRSAVETDQRARVARCSEDVCVQLLDLFLREELFQTAKGTLRELRCCCRHLRR